MAAEDRGYKSGYRTGIDHGRVAVYDQIKTDLWRKQDPYYREPSDSRKSGGWGGF
jgi:hypothetical protein